MFINSDKMKYGDPTLTVPVFLFFLLFSSVSSSLLRAKERGPLTLEVLPGDEKEDGTNMIGEPAEGYVTVSDYGPRGLRDMSAVTGYDSMAMDMARFSRPMYPPSPYMYQPSPYMGGVPSVGNVPFNNPYMPRSYYIKGGLRAPRFVSQDESKKSQEQSDSSEKNEEKTKDLAAELQSALGTLKELTSQAAEIKKQETEKNADANNTGTESTSMIETTSTTATAVSDSQQQMMQQQASSFLEKPAPVMMEQVQNQQQIDPVKQETSQKFDEILRTLDVLSEVPSS
mmetsp:Transcript_13664/g.15133  ORF Transcript_13664/g.15133 Transcript_13664/m.15133 type:complete len:285 (+) Transcript_13664:158-1012(+)